MKTIKTKFFFLLCGLLITLQTANCSNKNTNGNAETSETTAKTESVIEVSPPPFKKFVVVTTEDAGLYKKADKNSPTMVRWFESDCESDYCDNYYQWADQPGKPGFDLSTEIITYEGRVFPVLGEEGNFFKVYTLDLWCNIESAYIPKSCVGNIESAPIKADMLEAEGNDLNYRVMKDGKYKDIVFTDEYSELDGETLQVGVLTDGTVATPVVYHVDCQMIPQLEETTEHMVIEDDDDVFLLKYDKSLGMPVEYLEDCYQLNLKKLSAEQMAKIVDKVTSKKPEYVSYMYHFPAKGLESFYYETK